MFIQKYKHIDYSKQDKNTLNESLTINGRAFFVPDINSSIKKTLNLRQLLFNKTHQK